jgi:hypothetical protein
VRAARIVQRMNLKTKLRNANLKLKAVDNTLKKHGVARLATETERERIVTAAHGLTYE